MRARAAFARSADDLPRGRDQLRPYGGPRRRHAPNRLVLHQDAEHHAALSDIVEVEQAALRVLDRFDLSRPVRLLGVRVEVATGERSPERL